MIKKTLYPKTKRVQFKNRVVITEKLDGSNIGFFKVNGEFLGRFLSQRECANKYSIAATHISDLVNNKMTSCNGYIAILEEDFTQKILQEKIKNSKQTFRPFIAVNIKTLEQFGPFTTMKSCQEFFGFKSNHISEVLSGKRQSQNGYTFKFVD